MHATTKRDVSLIIAAGFVRSLTVGFIGVVLAVFLFRSGLSSLQIGFVIGAGLAGAALATTMSGFRADRIGRRRSLVALTLLTSLPLFVLALRTSFWVVLAGLLGASAS